MERKEEKMQRVFGKIFKELRAIRKEIVDLKKEAQERRERDG